MNEYRCKRIAYRYFFPEYKGKCKPGWVLHHRDPSWKTEDPERYYSWNIEDLIPMTRSQHMKWHVENDPEYNIEKSGEKSPMFGKHHSEESRKKMSEAHIGMHYSEDAKRKMSEAHIGKHLSAETKRKMSEASSGEKNPAFGTHYYNNGEICIRAKICPEGFIKGRILNK